MASRVCDKATDFELTVKTSEELEGFKLSSYYGTQIREIERRPEATAEFRQRQETLAQLKMRGLSF